MLFHEIYGTYFAVIAAILKQAVTGKLTRQEILRITSEQGFGESLLTIPQALTDGTWPLLNDHLGTPLQTVPSMPLSDLELRWMKTVLTDPRVRLFSPSMAGMEDVEPLYDRKDILWFDRNLDSDPFEDPSYIDHFHTVLTALRMKKRLHIRYAGKRSHLEGVFVPLGLEYSEKDDKFRLQTYCTAEPEFIGAENRSVSHNRGTAGFLGEAGSRGAAVSCDEAGSRGAAGSCGETGSRGAAGSCGETGSWGAAGSCGETGSRGAAGWEPGACRKRLYTFNLASIQSCTMAESSASADPASAGTARMESDEPEKDAFGNIRSFSPARQSVALELSDRRNALERAMLHFSDLEKETVPLGDGRYRIRLFYQAEDETEILIRILAFGPMIRVLSPESFVEQIRKRIRAQMQLGGS